MVKSLRTQTTCSHQSWQAESCSWGTSRVQQSRCQRVLQCLHGCSQLPTRMTLPERGNAALPGIWQVLTNVWCILTALLSHLLLYNKPRSSQTVKHKGRPQFFTQVNVTMLQPQGYYLIFSEVTMYLYQIKHYQWLCDQQCHALCATTCLASILWPLDLPWYLIQGVPIFNMTQADVYLWLAD